MQTEKTAAQVRELLVRREFIEQANALRAKANRARRLDRKFQYELQAREIEDLLGFNLLTQDA